MMMLFNQQTELPVGVIPLVRPRDRIVAGEARIAVMRLVGIAARLPKRAIQMNARLSTPISRAIASASCIDASNSLRSGVSMP